MSLNEILIVKERYKNFWVKDTVTNTGSDSSDYNNKLPSKREILDELAQFVGDQTMKHGKDKVHVDCSSLGWQEVAIELAQSSYR